MNHTDRDTATHTTNFSYRKIFSLIVKRDLTIAFRHKADMVNPLLFFIIVISLFPLGIGPDAKILARIAPGVIWVAALLAILLSLERLFKHDFDDGSLEQLMISPYPLFVIVIAKVFTHWLITSLPLLIVAPILAVMLHLPESSYLALFLTLLFGTPVLNFIGAIGAALTVGIKKGGVLLSLIVLPLNIPVLIFATSAIEAATMNLNYSGHIAIIGVFFVLSVMLAPIAVSLALKVSTN